MALRGIRGFSIDSVPAMTRREVISIEKLSLGWAWHKATNAASLTCELLCWATPPTTNVDPPEVVEARFEIANVLSYITMFAEGAPIVAPPDIAKPDEHPKTTLYWHAVTLGKRVVEACNRAAVVQKDARLRDRWYGVGRSTQHAVEFIRKFATDNPVIGAADGAAGGILNRISMTLAHAGKPTEEIVGRVLHWRVRDALKGKELPPELDVNLRPAFEVAWSAGEYEFAYSLLADLDTLAVP